VVVCVVGFGEEERKFGSQNQRNSSVKINKFWGINMKNQYRHLSGFYFLNGFK
jgi:hypothetical protein